MEQNVNKAQKIKNTLQETKERRKEQRPIVFQLKLQNLSKEKEKNLTRAFLEAKWLYNWLVSDTERLNLSVNKIREVEVKVKEGFEKRELLLLG
jgi:putative transposase